MWNTKMDHQWNYAIGLPDPRDLSGRHGLASFNPASIWVNAQGKRFVNEFAGAKESLPALLAQQGATFWSIFDHAGKWSFSVTLSGWDDFQQIERLIFSNSELVKSAPSVVLDRKYECAACHAELVPYRPDAHQIDRLAQIQNCTFCHGLRKSQVRR